VSITLDTILEAAVDKPDSLIVIPRASSLLDLEYSKAALSDLSSNLTSNPIQVGEPYSTKDPVFNIPEIKIPTPTVIISGVSDAISSSLKNIFSSNSSITNQLSNILNESNQTSFLNTSNFNRFEGSNFSNTTNNNNSTKLITENFSKVFSLTNQIDNSVSSKVNELIKSSNITTNSIIETASTVLDRVVNSIKETDSFIKESVIPSISSIVDRSEPASSQSKVSKNEESYVKTNTLVDSSTVKRIIEPDRTVERSVGQLAKVLPETINNLSSTMSSMNNSNSSNSTSILNEGSKFDQSSNTTVVNQSQNTQSGESETLKNTSDSSPINPNFYMEAIYQALISGKVKVSLKY
jgi:hypothetical protein